FSKGTAKVPQREAVACLDGTPRASGALGQAFDEIAKYAAEVNERHGQETDQAAQVSAGRNAQSHYQAHAKPQARLCLGEVHDKPDAIAFRGRPPRSGETGGGPAVKSVREHRGCTGGDSRSAT